MWNMKQKNSQTTIIRDMTKAMLTRKLNMTHTNRHMVRRGSKKPDEISTETESYWIHASTC